MAISKESYDAAKRIFNENNGSLHLIARDISSMTSLDYDEAVLSLVFSLRLAIAEKLEYYRKGDDDVR